MNALECWRQSLRKDTLVIWVVGLNLASYMIMLNAHADWVVVLALEVI